MAYLTKESLDQLKNIKFFVYLRKSSEDNEDRQIRSIPGQRMDIEEHLIHKYGLNVVRPYFEESQSAFKEDRPDFNNMLDRINHGEAQGVISWHPNRLARNYGDGGRFVQAMLNGKVKAVLTCAGIFDNNARDRDYLMTEFTRATRDSDDKSEAVKRGNKVRFFEKQQWVGPAKIGFINVINPVTREKEISEDPDRHPLLEKAVRLLLSGSYTPMQVLHMLNNDWGFRTRKTRRQGGKPLSKSAWYKFLCDPYMYGLMVRSEGQQKSEHKAFATEEEFDTLQIMLGRKGKPRVSKHEFAFKEPLKCGECGGSITAEEHWQIICPQCKIKFNRSKSTERCKGCGILIEEMKNPKILHYVHYHCTKRINPKCSQGSISLEKLEQQIDEELSKFEIKEEFKDWAIEYLNELNAKENKERHTSRNNTHQALEDTVKKLDNLTNLYISPQNANKEMMTDEEYQSRLKSLREEKESLSRLAKTIDKQQDNWHDLTARTFNFACYARYWFAHGTLKEKTEILGALGSNLTITDKKLRVEGLNPFLIIADGTRRVEKLSKKFEPALKPDITGQMAPLEAIRTSWLTDIDAIRTFWQTSQEQFYIPNYYANIC